MLQKHAALILLSVHLISKSITTLGWNHTKRLRIDCLERRDYVRLRKKEILYLVSRTATSWCSGSSSPFILSFFCHLQKLFKLLSAWCVIFKSSCYPHVTLRWREANIKLAARVPYVYMMGRYQCTTKTKVQTLFDRKCYKIIALGAGKLHLSAFDSAF